jgi:outer membrane protein assembly factor BamD (BamD/ComL family)
VIAISLSGCAGLKEIKTSWNAREHLVTARTLFDQGDYEGSLRANYKVISLCDNSPPEDEALFYSGVIYAHYGYPKRDYQKSLDLFKKLVRNFPQSPYTGKAKIFIGILQENERSKREIEALNKTIKKSKQVDIEIDEKMKGLSK